MQRLFFLCVCLFILGASMRVSAEQEYMEPLFDSWGVSLPNGGIVRIKDWDNATSFLCGRNDGVYSHKTWNQFWGRWKITCIRNSNGESFAPGHIQEGRVCPPGFTGSWFCASVSGYRNDGKNRGKPKECAGNPVDLSNGRKYEEELDYVHSVNPLLRFERFYNLYYHSPGRAFYSYSDLMFPIHSKELFKGYLPWIWTHTYSRYLELMRVTAESEVERVYAYRHDQRVLRFSRNELTGQWESTDSDRAEVIRKEMAGNDTFWIYETESDEKEKYDSEGRLVSIEKGGFSVQLEYFEDRLVVSDDFGHSLIIRSDDEWGVDGLIRSVELPDGEQISFKYLKEGNDNNPIYSLNKALYPDGTGYIYRYTRGLSKKKDLNGNVISSWSYDANVQERVKKSTKGSNLVDTYSFKYSANYDDPLEEGERSVTVTNPLGKKTTYFYKYITGSSKLVRVEGHPTTSCLGANKAYSYNINGFMTSKTDWQGNVTSYTRDSRGLELSRTEANGTPEARTITTEWHSNYRLPVKITEPGKITEYTYDAQGRQLSRTVRNQP